MNVETILNDFLADFRSDPGKYVWWVIGFIGEGGSFGRFVVQWIATERKKRTVVPLAFWYMSIFGSLIILAYSMHRRDPVFIAATLLGMVIYFRNLHIAKRPGAQVAPDA